MADVDAELAAGGRNALCMQVVAEVAAYKKEHHMEIYDPRRERQVLDKIANLTVQKELSPYLRRIYQCIMDESKKYEREHMGL